MFKSWRYKSKPSQAVLFNAPLLIIQSRSFARQMFQTDKFDICSQALMSLKYFILNNFFKVNSK